MKTYKNLYPRIVSFADLYQAFRAARKGKRDHAAVAGFEFDLESNLLALAEELNKGFFVYPLIFLILLESHVFEYS